ncbi:KxYKxGKxW signal peptide domain-containing protein, partial [Listeria innocua]|uniref:leucine-rich repeat domain-containing protein n=1 Tax=Listeria innocua TaxID=1642 RepID=UPI00162A60FE
MRFSRKAREQKQKNWRMWKKGKQWLCGAALFFTVVSSPGMLVLADEVNTGNSTAVTAGEVETAIPEESTENEAEEAAEEDETSSTEAVAPSQQEENTPSTAANNGTKTVEGKKERPKQGRLITTPTAIRDIFPDANLAELVRGQLGKASVNDIVTQSDLDGVISLNAYNKNITDISGMEHLTNIMSLSLRSNEVSDISPLSGLTNLTALNFDNNQVSDISPLSGLTNLYTELSFSNNQVSDISPLSGLTNLTALIFSGNQVSDISPLSGLTNLTALVFSDNQVSDISPLSGLNLTNLLCNNNEISDISVLSSMTRLNIFDAQNQQVTVSGIKWSNQLELPFTQIKSLENRFGTLSPRDISNGGRFSNSVITWIGLPNSNQDISYRWQQIDNNGRGFSGTVTIRVEPVGVKILVDSDGDSQTTGDQTLFAEETSNLATLEDMYNYAKDQLNGTNYGLINIASDSNGDYVILVSRVGSLKKEDASGTAVGTDVPYTPTYTVTGTGNTAQLEVSYGVTVDAPPTGYVYIYGKGTAQEARSTASTSITIPLTDTNGNGTPQWKEDYTVKQYKKAGALHPSIPGGDQEVIGVPGDAVGGDIVTIPPDTITGSDGREYIVDPSIDIDPNTPGVQITLTDDEQDIPYLDVLLSESESTSASLSES